MNFSCRTPRPPVCRVTLARSIFSQTGTINPGLLFRTFPTALLTIHAFISSAGYRLRKSTSGQLQQQFVPVLTVTF